MVSYKQKCMRCNKNYVLADWRNKYPLCYDCEKPELNGDLKDPKMKELFDVPEECYKLSSFLRSIKKNYLRFGELTEKQIEAFKKVVGDLKAKIKQEQ